MTDRDDVELPRAVVAKPRVAGVDAAGFIDAAVARLGVSTAPPLMTPTAIGCPSNSTAYAPKSRAGSSAPPLRLTTSWSNSACALA